MAQAAEKAQREAEEEARAADEVRTFFDISPV